MIIKITDYIKERDSDWEKAGKDLKRDIKNSLDKGDVVELDFLGYDAVGVTKFLNIGIGELYKEYTPKVLNGKLKVTKISETALDDLKDVIEIAKKRFVEGEFK
ncbi:MAG: STAS-like domain-containing protein [Mycoplasmoidaceae bacterium]